MPQFREVVYGVTPPISSNSNQLITAEWVLFKTRGILPDNIKMTVPWTTVSDDFTEATLDLSKTTLVTDWGTPETFFTTYKGIKLYYFGYNDTTFLIPADGATTECNYLEGKIKVTRNGNILTFKSWWSFTDNDGKELPYPIFRKQLPNGNYEKETSRTIFWVKLPEIIKAQCYFANIDYNTNEATINFNEQGDVQQVLDWTTDAKTFFDNYKFLVSIGTMDVNVDMPEAGSSTTFKYFKDTVTLSRDSANNYALIFTGSQRLINNNLYSYVWAKNKDVLI